MAIEISPPIYHWEPTKLKGKRVMIVGGTHGVGEAVAKMCLDGGARVEVIGLSLNRGLDCRQHLFNVVDSPETADRLIVGADYVFNNIGAIWRGLIAETPRGIVQHLLKVNIETMFLLNQYAITSGVGVVVNMSSRPIFREYATWSLYALTKHALIDLTKAASEESKTKFYAFCPSRMDTKFRDSIYPDEDKNTRMTPDEAAKVIVTLFNGKNPSGKHYWVRRA